VTVLPIVAIHLTTFGVTSHARMSAVNKRITESVNWTGVINISDQLRWR